MQNGVRALLANHKLVPVVNFRDFSQIKVIGEKLIAQNIHCIEITLRSDIAVEAIVKTKEIFGDRLSLGVGTIVNLDQIKRMKEIGVDFLVSPGATAELITAMQDSGIPFLPGVMTPSEIISGMELGLDTFKLFPANIAGGIKALKAYGAVFSHAKFCPTGGIGKDNYNDYLELTNVICVGGSWLAK